MTKEHKQLLDDAMSSLKSLKDHGDIEIAHIMADGVLCKLLCSLGFNEVVNEFEKIEKWYA